jgi:spermidine/putrescine transport system substrate-binding protein
MADDPIRILLPRSTAQRLAATINRRRFLSLTAGAAATGAVLAACGGDDGDTGASGETDDDTGASSSGGDVDRNIQVFTWAEYDDPDLLSEWGTFSPTIFNSNEEAIQRLAAAGGSSGFDIVVPTGVYIPQMASEGLLQKLDKSKIPNFANLDSAYADQDWDRGNEYSVCKNWGTTGWLYDNEVVTTPISTWADFIAAAQTEASGQTSVLDTAPNLTGIYFWANGISWTTEDAADLDACEEFLVNEFAQHIKAFDSFPGIALQQGSYALSQVWNGDARQGFGSIVETGGDPERYTWGIGAPETELWMDNWCITAGAPNADGAHDFINWILDPVNSAVDLQFHGYNTGLTGLQDQLPEDLPFREMVFFTDEEVGRMRSGAVNSAQDRLVEIYNATKGAAGG